MRLPLVLAVATHLSVINAFAQSATFARTDYPFLGNDHIVFDLNRDGRMDLVGRTVRRPSPVARRQRFRPTGVTTGWKSMRSAEQVECVKRYIPRLT
jgi:hypothetical protein